MSVNETNRLVSVFKDVTTVIHLASNPDIAAATTNPRIDFTQGTSLTESVVEAVRLSGVQTLLYASGSGVYGRVEHDPVTEDHQLLPISPYGASKLAGESLLSSYSYMFGFKSVAFRFANVVGPRQTHGVGYDFIHKLKKNPKELVVLGDGSQKKSYIHVDDVVSAILHVESKDMDFFQAYNVSTFDTLSVKEIVNLAVKTLNVEERDLNVVYGTEDRGWKGDVPQIRLSSTKLEKTGWRATKSSEQSMQSSLVWMRDNI
jgi:UDP-glucose 4-epimerase